MGDDLDAALAAIDHAFALADEDAARALEVASDDTIAALQKAGSTGVEAKAWWSRGLAFRQLGRRQEAFEALDRAESLYRRAGETDQALRVAISLAFEKAIRGQVDVAVSVLESAAQQLAGVDSASASAQLALVLHRAGRDDASLVAWDKAIDAFRACDSPRFEARTFLNRGIIRAEWGDFEGADADLSEAARLNEAIGDEFEMVGIAHNRGYIAARQGNLALALQWFDDSQRRATSLSVQRPEILLDRAEALSEAGLLAEARAVVENAISLLETLEQRADLAEACLAAAKICLAQGQAPQAQHWARRARAEFEGQARLRWVSVARYYEILSESGWSPEERANALLEVSEALRSAGWTSCSFGADATAVALLLQAGRRQQARIPLARLRELQNGGTNLDRLLAWIAETRFRVSEEKYAEAGRSMDAAVNALLAHQAVNGSTELRVQGAGRADEAVALAMALGNTTHSTIRTLGWIERIRFSQEPRGIEDDPEMARRLEELRNITNRIDSSPLEPQEQRRLRSTQRAMEELVRRRARHAVSREDQGIGTPRELVDILADRVLIEYIPSGDRLSALVFEHGHGRCIDLPSVAEIRRAVAGLRMTMIGMVAGHPDSEASKPTKLDDRLEALSALLIDPLGLSDSKAETVVVPWGAVGSVPWGALPPFASRPVVVAPSATAWARAVQLRSGAGTDDASRPQVVIVCGPGLLHSAEESEAVREIWGSHAQVLDGDEATVEAAMAVLASADLVHFATHGSFRSDSPLLSSLQLASGPLTGYDVSRLKRVPTTVVLSCCETGMTDADSPGTFGLSGLLLASGARSIVASVIPVVDEAAFHFTIPFHRELRAHGRVADALLYAKRESSSSDYSGLGFCCFGAA